MRILIVGDGMRRKESTDHSILKSLNYSPISSNIYAVSIASYNIIVIYFYLYLFVLAHIFIFVFFFYLKKWVNTTWSGSGNKTFGSYSFFIS